MSRCTAMAYTNDPAKLVIRCELSEGHGGNHASAKDLAAVDGRLDALQAGMSEAARMINSFVEGMRDVITVFERPKNLPHDPALRKDRRKWGGR